MARAINARRDTDAELIQAFIEYQRFMQETFPTANGLETIAKLESGEPVYVPAVDLWQAAFRAALPSNDLLEASYESVIFEVSADGVHPVGVYEDEFSYSHRGTRNQQRDAINTRWLRR